MAYSLTQLVWHRLRAHPLLLLPPIMLTVFSDTLVNLWVPASNPPLLMGVGWVLCMVGAKWVALVWQTHWTLATYRLRLSIHPWFLFTWFGLVMASEWVLLLSHFRGRDSLGLPFQTVPTLWHLPLSVMALLVVAQLLMAWFFPLLMVERWQQIPLRTAILRVVRYAKCVKPMLGALWTAFGVAFICMLVTLLLSSIPIVGATIQRVGLGLVMGTWHLIWVVAYCHRRHAILRSPDPASH